jgi:hypothetical protein
LEILLANDRVLDLIVLVKDQVKRESAPKSFEQEARMIRAFVDQMIKRGESREFLIKNGFHTPTGKLTKRYGG